MAAGRLFLNNWGSPGVVFGWAASGESVTLYGMEITFTGGGPIDANSIGIGNGAACVGSGTTFCTIDFTDRWEATQVAPDTIDFLAPSPTYDLTPGQSYFVNVFFDGDTPNAFTGDWLTTYTPAASPEPAALGLAISGLAALLLLARRRRSLP